jgi:hypothetical protein
LCNKKHSPGDRAIMMGRPPGLVQPTIEAYYGFAAEAAEAAAADAAAAALASAAAALASAAAAEAAVSAEAAAGAGGASVLLPQALSRTAATKALIASLVFIYRYPKIFNDITDKGHRFVLGLRQEVINDFRGF